MNTKVVFTIYMFIYIYIYVCVFVYTMTINEDRGLEFEESMGEYMGWFRGRKKKEET